MLELYQGMIPATAQPAAVGRQPNASRVEPAASDPYDAMAPVVSDVSYPPVQAAWPDWNGNGARPLSDEREQVAQPEPLAVAAREDTSPVERERPAPWNEPMPTSASADRPSDSTPISNWSTSQSPQAPEHPDVDSDQGWQAPDAPPPVAPPPVAPPSAESAPPPTPPESAPPQSPLEFALPQPPVEVQLAAPANMVLRIELAIVDETKRVSPVDAARRVGPDAEPGDYDEAGRYTPRHPEFEPRNHVGRDRPAREQEYGHEPSREQEYDWQPPVPASPRRPEPPVTVDWDLPSLEPPRQHEPEAPWSAPIHQPPVQQPIAPAPTWAMTEPAPQYVPPMQPAPQPAPPAWPPRCRALSPAPPRR